MIFRGVQAVITGGYWLKPLTAERLFFLPPVTTNRIGGGGYFYNRRLAVITLITGGFKTAFEFQVWAGFKVVWVGFTLVLGRFLYRFNFFKKKNKKKINTF